MISRFIGKPPYITKSYSRTCRRYMQYFDTSDHGKSIEGMKIIPLETTELKQIIKNHLTYRQLYPLFEQAYRSEKKLPQWYEEEIIDRLLQA